MASDEIANVQFRLRGAAFSSPRISADGEVQPDREVSVLQGRLEPAAGEGPREEDARPESGARGFEYPSPWPTLPRAPVPPSELPEIQTDGPTALSPQILGTDGTPPPPSDQAPDAAAASAVAPRTEPKAIATDAAPTTGEPTTGEPTTARLDERAVGTLVLADKGGSGSEPTPAVNEFLAGDVVDVRA